MVDHRLEQFKRFAFEIGTVGVGRSKIRPFIKFFEAGGNLKRAQEASIKRDLVAATADVVGRRQKEFNNYLFRPSIRPRGSLTTQETDGAGVGVLELDWHYVLMAQL